MRFLEQNWPIILVTWMIFLITIVAVKLIFWETTESDLFTVEELINGVLQNDSRLLEHIHGSQLYPPPLIKKKQQNISDLQQNPIAEDLTDQVVTILKGKKAGFFVECRAYDGNVSSKTLKLEQKYNWTGILLEPDPLLFPSLISQQRNAWLLNACLSPDNRAQTLEFLRKTKFNQNKSKPVDSLYRDRKGQFWKKLRIPCFPLFSIISAMDRTRKIDFLLLDSQGLELQILLNVPWDVVNIQMISANVQSIPEGPEGLKLFMEKQNFTLISAVGDFYTFVHQRVVIPKL